MVIEFVDLPIKKMVILQIFFCMFTRGQSLRQLAARYRGGTDDHAAYHKAWDEGIFCALDIYSKSRRDIMAHKMVVSVNDV